MIKTLKHIDLIRPIHKKTYAWKKEEGCAIVISPKGERVILNPRSTSVWEQIDEFKNAMEIIDWINHEGNVNVSADQMVDILNNFLQLDLISMENYLWKED